MEKETMLWIIYGIICATMIILLLQAKQYHDLAVHFRELYVECNNSTLVPSWWAT